jgi:hypothetical protein
VMLLYVASGPFPRFRREAGMTQGETRLTTYSDTCN